MRQRVPRLVHDVVDPLLIVNTLAHGNACVAMMADVAAGLIEFLGGHLAKLKCPRRVISESYGIRIR